MRRILIGSVLAALAMFFWGALVWVGPATDAVFMEVPDQEALSQDLLAQLRSSGVYLLPWDPHDMPTTEALQREGPLATIHFRRQGVEPGSLWVLVGGFLHMLVSALIFAATLKVVAPALPTYKSRVSFIFLIALALAVFCNLEQPIWWHQSWSFHIFHTFYDSSSWLIGGLVLAAFVRSPQEEAEASPGEDEGIEEGALGV